MRQLTGVSVVVPVRNGSAHLEDAIAAIASQAAEYPFEIIAIDDGSTDGSRAILDRLARRYPLHVMKGPGRGAAAAVNAGILAAKFEVVCQIDQDVIVASGWLKNVLGMLEDSSVAPVAPVAAVQGCYVTDPGDRFLARLMSLDLEQRYEAMTHIDHVCTGNTAYRLAALTSVGLLDETLGYGYDNDLSYRLQSAGYRLAFCPGARSFHRWRSGLTGYIVQQYGFGYGRLDVVSRHPGRWMGDAVSPGRMMMHPLVTGLALCLLAPATVSLSMKGSAGLLALAGIACLATLALERSWAGLRAWRRRKDPAALAFPLVHMIRDLAWVAAGLVWLCRRAVGAAPQPRHSMAARRGTG